MIDGQIVLKGGPELRRALGKLDKDIRKELDDSIKAAASPLVGKAQAQVREAPLSGAVHSGRLGWNAAKVRSGIKIKVGKAREGSLLKLENTNAAGSLFELAGSKSSTPFTEALRAAWPDRPGRMIWKAAMTGGLAEVRQAALKAYEKAADDFNQRNADRSMGLG